MCLCVCVCVSVCVVYACLYCCKCIQICLGVFNGYIHTCRNSSLSRFFEEFFAVLSSLRNERDHSTLMAMVKRKVDFKDPVEVEYASLLTLYALGFVSKQLALRHKVGIIHESATDCQVSSSEGIIEVTTETCQ